MLLIIGVGVAVYLAVMFSRITPTNEFVGFLARFNAFQLTLRKFIGYALMIIALLAVIGNSIAPHKPEPNRNHHATTQDH